MNDPNGNGCTEVRPEPTKSRFRHMPPLLVVLVVFATLVLLRFRGPARYEVRGTIIHVDVSARRATLEYINPANGATREVSGEVPESCTITIDGEPASLPDLKIGDAVLARAVIERGKESGKREKRIVAEELHVTRVAREAP